MNNIGCFKFYFLQSIHLILVQPHPQLVPLLKLLEVITLTQVYGQSSGDTPSPQKRKLTAPSFCLVKVEMGIEDFLFLC